MGTYCSCGKCTPDSKPEIPEDFRQIANTDTLYSRAEVSLFFRRVPPNLEGEYMVLIHEQLKDVYYTLGPINKDCLRELRDTLNDVVDDKR